MESFEPLIEKHDAINERIRRVDLHGELALESNDYTPELLSDLNAQYSAIHAEIGHEAFDRLRELKNKTVAAAEQVSAVAKATYRNASKLIESMRIAFDKTGGVALIRSRSRLDEVGGDISSADIVKNRSLTKRLHIGGEIPRDLRKAASTAMMMSKYLRSTVVPQIDQAVIKAANEVLIDPPKSPEEFATSIDQLMKITAGTKSLADLIKDEELTRQYPGGLMLCNRNLKVAALPENADIADSASQKVRKKLQAINSRRLQLNRVPSRHRLQPTTDNVKLLTRQQSEDILAVAASLIVEGKALTNIQRLFKGYPATSIADGLKVTLSAMRGKLVKDVETKAFTDTGVHVDVEDRVRCQWLQTYYSSSMMQHHQILPAFASILFEMANAYIALADESMKHYQ